MPALAWEPGGPLAPYHRYSFIRLDHILTPDTRASLVSCFHTEGGSSMDRNELELCWVE